MKASISCLRLEVESVAEGQQGQDQVRSQGFQRPGKQVEFIKEMLAAKQKAGLFVAELMNILNLRVGEKCY